jgi:peptidoglycan-N-acetylmuramic acid deacetylase
MIGSLYTRAQLLAMDTTYNAGGYGAGSTSGGKRPGGPVSDQNKYGQYGGNSVGQDEKKVYLTFDCGYEYTATDASGKSYRVTERILDILKEKNTKAVFFVTMDYVKAQPDLVQRMVDEGHVVGNHSNTHPVMPQQTIDRMVEEVMSLHNYVKEHFGYSMTLVRPPTGAFSIQSLSLLKSLGYKSVLWSFQYYDYDTAKQPSHDSALKTVTDRHHNGAIYLLHAVSVTNASILSEAIDTFEQLGYQVALFQ